MAPTGRAGRAPRRAGRCLRSADAGAGWCCGRCRSLSAPSPLARIPPVPDPSGRAAPPERCRKEPRRRRGRAGSPPAAPAHGGAAAGWCRRSAVGERRARSRGRSQPQCQRRAEHRAQPCLWWASTSASSTATSAWRGAAASRPSPTSTATAARREYRRARAAPPACPRGIPRTARRCRQRAPSRGRVCREARVCPGVRP